jgi:NAD+ diphosphatase
MWMLMAQILARGPVRDRATLAGVHDATRDFPPLIDPSTLSLARSVLDRAADRRHDDAWLAEAWSRPDTQVLVVAADRLAVTDDRHRLAFVTSSEAPEGERAFLGVDRRDERAVFAVLTPEAREDYATLREAGAFLDDREAGIAVHAVGLANWHATHPRCARCGAATDVAEAGHIRRCPDCGAQHFPRSDPAMIVLVTDDEDRALLGRNANWPPGRYSTLAGFVEPGESLEAAVRREVFEETGVVVGYDIRYAGSQPWPFPSSLMVGFFARAVSKDIDVDDDELEAARWFTRDQMRAEAEAGTLLLPGGISISRSLIEAWYGGPLPGQW